MDDQPAPATPARSLRYAAFALALVVPGLGHVLIGRGRRGAAWLASILLGVAGAYLVAGLGSPWVWWSVLALLPFAHVLGVLDTWRLQGRVALPRPRTVAAAAVAMAVAVLLVVSAGKRHVVELFEVPSAAMYPTLIAGDRVMASKIQRPFAAGDVVLFRMPFDDEGFYLKRIVAVAGDRVETRQGELWINDRPVARRDTGFACRALGSRHRCRIWEENLGGRFYRVATREERPTSSRPVVVPANHVYVLGDNRDKSVDSRHYGSIPTARLVGESLFIAWSSDAGGVRWVRVNDPID
jgi:signal peptidase I